MHDNESSNNEINNSENESSVNKSQISKNIRKVLIVFLICFIGIIVYISYFEVFVGPKLVTEKKYNKRLWATRNEVLRGTIYDRNMNALSKSERVNTTNQKREYTGGEAFAHVLGYDDIKYGSAGLESKYDTQLMNDRSQNYLEYLLNINFVDLFKGKSKKDEKFGRNVVTTLDSKLQKQAYDLLGNNKGAVVALNPKTGEILALVSKPSYDPNNLSTIWSSIYKSNDRPLLNRAISGLYPPGSTFKTVTAVSALQNMSDIQNRTFIDNGRLVFNSKESLTNFEGETLGNLSFKNAYVHSSNVVFGTIGLELGNDKLKATAQQFYFNTDVPCDDLTIDHSRFPTYKKYEKGNIAQSAIGQSGVLASPMQMALVAETIANNGVMMKPYLVKQVVDKDNKNIKTTTSEEIGQITTPDIAKTMKTFMREVVTSGTGTVANVSGLDVCGKTGTAEHSDGNNTTPHSWFISFGPYESPQIAIAVIVEDGGQGAGAAGNITAQLMKTALSK